MNFCFFQVRDKAQRASRVLLDIEAGAPVLLIPESSKSNSLIVANLGKLKVKNKFLFAGMPGTFSLKNKVKTLLLNSTACGFSISCAFYVCMKMVNDSYILLGIYTLYY